VHAGATVYDEHNAKVAREVVRHNTATALVDKANFRHFMAKEIHEQPEVVGHTLAHYVDMATERVALPVGLPFDFSSVQRVSITACGTASYAGFVAKYWFERLARLPVELDVASEFRYREAPLRKGDLAIFYLAVRRDRGLRWRRCATPRRRACTPSPSSTCRPRRSRARAKTVLPTLAGPEIASPRRKPSPASYGAGGARGRSGQGEGRAFGGR